MNSRKFLAASLLMASASFAGGIYTNTNQSAAFIRDMARDATTENDAAYSNPAGTGFMNDGWHLSLNTQMFFQSRTVKTSFVNGENSTYEGETFVPTMPSLLATYKTGNLAVSGGFTVAGGGGSVEFDDGIPTFDALGLSLTRAMGMMPPKTLSAMDVTPSLEASMYTFGLTLGAAYRFIPMVSGYVGARYNYTTNNYSAEADLTKLGMGKMELDVEQTGWGITPIFGLSFQYKGLTVGTKFEYNTSIEVENDTKKMPDAMKSSLPAFADGAKNNADLPSYFAFGVQYAILNNLRAAVSYHHFYDYWADYSGDEESTLGGTNEYLFGAEWDIIPSLTVSGGVQLTRFALSDEFQSDMNFNTDANTFGGGVAYRINERVRVNLAYFYTYYMGYKNDKEAYGTNKYDRENQAIALGADLDF
ncbi:MAG: hypothetical protein HUK20_04795 [Fibrobacter sp.]|nr:hypothetical protein [Fibrobacter sp.]